MVDREKVIRGLEACIEPCCRGNDCPYFYDPDCGVLKKDALQLLKEQEPQWISVKDRLPDIHPCQYLVVNDGKLDMAIFMDGYWITSGRLCITHWMPFPKLPEEGESNG